MEIKDLEILINNYKSGETYRGWTMDNNSFHYSNDYINVKRIDSSNKWINDDKMSKMWSIIFEMKKNFMFLRTFKDLQNKFNIAITPVLKGVNKGCYGLRFYDMKTNPDNNIIKDILDYIFTKETV